MCISNSNRCPCVEQVIMWKHTKADVHMGEFNCLWQDLASDCSTSCEPEVMNAEDSLFILYTSGSTGTPKGVAALSADDQLLIELNRHFSVRTHVM